MPVSPFARAYDFEKLFQLERLKITIEKAEVAFDDLAPETIDFCKCIIETMCKHILDEKGEDYENLELPRLVKDALSAASFQNDQIRGNLSGLMNALGEMRNKKGIAGHGNHGQVPLPSENDIRVFVSVFQSVTTILWHSFTPQNIDVRHTKLEFKALEEKLKLGWLNQVADENIIVEYSEEDGLIYVEGKEIRPSEILYLFDRENYVKKIEKTKSEAREFIFEQLADTISEALTDGIFDGFEPHAYGWEYPEVSIDDAQADGDKLNVSGTISTSVRLGAPSAKDGIDLDYLSDFTALFYASTAGSPQERDFSLEELNIEHTDWFENLEEDYD